MQKKNKYSIRKTTLGVGSVLIASLLTGMVSVQAEEGMIALELPLVEEIAEVEETLVEEVPETSFAEETLEPLEESITPLEQTEESLSLLDQELEENIESAENPNSEVTNIEFSSNQIEAQVMNMEAPQASVPLVFNEIESNDPNGGPDWAEIFNKGTETIDISGWAILDDKSFTRLDEGAVNRLPEGTTIAPNGFYTFKEDKDFTFGLGKADTVTLIDALDNIIDEFTWSGGHASGTYGRKVDGEGEMVDLAEATKNASNAQEEKPVLPEEPIVIPSTVVINEVESNDPAKAPDWAEVFNKGTEAVDISAGPF